MYEATYYPVNGHSIDYKPIATSVRENSPLARSIVARSSEDRRGTKPRNLYAVKVYDRRVAQRRQQSL